VLATTAQPERYSALYFDNSVHLPQYAPAGKKEMLTFHVANYEGKTTTYTYIASMQIGNKATPLGTGSTTLFDGNSSTHTIIFTMPTPNTSATITINLSGRTEHLQFRSQS
jgi:hypothetical protein